MSSVHFSIKKIVSLILCVCLVICAVLMLPIGDVEQASATTVEEYKSYIEQLEAEQKEIEAELKALKNDKAQTQSYKNTLQRKIDNLQSQINACNRQINDFSDKIAELQLDIEKKQEQLNETKYKFRQRLRAIYMSGGATSSSLALIFSAENLEELLSKSELTKSISAYDTALMKRIINDVKTIEANQVEIQKLSEDQKAAKAVLAQKKSELNSQIKEVNSELSDIGKDISSLQNQSNAIDKAIDEYEEAIKNAQNVGKDQAYDGQFSWPCPGYRYVTSPYGYRTHPISGQYKFHKGIDIAGSGIKGKPIVAAADGIVSIATYNSGGYGYYVMVNHGTGADKKTYVTLYAHMTKYIVKVGQTVKRGQTIGYVGTTGASTGYHLHFEVRVNGDTTNPMKYF